MATTASRASGVPGTGTYRVIPSRIAAIAASDAKAKELRHAALRMASSQTEMNNQNALQKRVEKLQRAVLKEIVDERRDERLFITAGERANLDLSLSNVAAKANALTIKTETIKQRSMTLRVDLALQKINIVVGTWRHRLMSRAMQQWEMQAKLI